MKNNFNSRVPKYNDDSDYKTNAPSYYDDLARKNKLIQYLAEQIGLHLDEAKRILDELILKIGEGFNQEIYELLTKWVEDGTLDHIINETLMNKKADKTELTALENALTEKINKHITTAEQTFTSIDNRFNDINEEFITMDDQFNLLNNTIGMMDKDIDKNTQSINKTNQNINQLQRDKKNKMEGYIFASDHEKLPNETDDKFINRLFTLLPNKQGTVYLEGKTYLLENRVELRRHQILIGSGHETVLKANNTDMVDVVRVINQTDQNYEYGIVIKNLTLQGTKFTTGINLRNATHVLMENLMIYDNNWGIWGSNVWLAHYNRVTIRNYEFMGEDGFVIESGTSNHLNNVWIRNFKRGYNIGSKYNALNVCACDKFTEYAYLLHRGTTLNGCGAENAELVEGGFVFGARARSVTFNNCEILDIHYDGRPGHASMFYFYGTQAVVNGFANAGTYVEPNLTMIMLRATAYVNVNNFRYPSGFYEMYNFSKYGATSSVVFEQTGTRLAWHRHNGMTVISEST